MPFTNLDWVLGTEEMHIPAGDPDVDALIHAST
jgi:hypothetical protein